MKILVSSTPFASLNVLYTLRSPSIIPPGFSTVCIENSWDPLQTWSKLNGLDEEKDAYYGAENGSYIYLNKSDGMWWVDTPDGGGKYVAPGGKGEGPPKDQGLWRELRGVKTPTPKVEYVE
eukprot:CAMPEP_0118651924 /NCGR_PEP_ID=MMETSP0785-20121206/11042_1 /TAXON_ID=91992 /ORGANISM="Bolidomonas pacifica, Strain CCMP 1866" /LENGTH=120 /DNA_ID=CAMNT_0006544403 /DNA_START=163 /DNA_END=525 /DNA_ORIENTATION=-